MADEQKAATVDVADAEHELPMLVGIGNFLHWVEEFLVMLSGPLLTVGLGIGIVDLLSDGALLVNLPGLLYAWAIAQTVGVDGQLIGAWARVAKSFRRGNWWAALGFIALGALLAYVGFVSALVFAYQTTYHITIADALAKLGIDSVSWLWQRTAVSVGLVCLSGLLRYSPPREQLSLEEKKRRIAESSELRAARQAAAGQGIGGFIGMAKGAVGAARNGPLG
jgi:hypothetical protein